MKKHELLKYAYDNYPKGTKFTWGNGNDHISNNFFFFPFDSNAIFSEDKNGCQNTLFDGSKWAEIVKPKIAVKIEKEKEFKALMKYYDSLGYRHWNLDNGWIGSYVTFEKEYNWLLDGQTEDYQIIPFSEFAVKRNIKLPYFTTIDKVDVYYEDEFYWMTEKHHVPVQSFMLGSMPDSDLLCFSTKQAALDWIEAQKPKSEILGMNNSTQEAEVFKDGKVLIRYAGMEIPIHYYDISRLQEAYKRLNK